MAAGLVLAAASGCASQQGTAAGDDGSLDSRVAPTQNTQATGTVPAAASSKGGNTGVSDDQSRASDSDTSALPRVAPTQSTKGTGAYPDAKQQ
ncbi:hypothetical protein D3260_08245 [Salinisphaera sp. Q1T1-3]|nr:hypothetical protein D3260_08245 [Salinisphaera sp. Q1T1-3]